MSKVYSSAVVIIPPKSIWLPIQEIREIHDRHINRWMPHITLFYPFRPEKEYPAIEQMFIEKCRTIKPFEINLNSFHYFSHKNQQYTMWLNPEPVNLIRQLLSNFLKLIPDCDDVNKFKNGFTPHLSVGQTKGKVRIGRIINDLQNNWKPLNFLLDEIYFISRDNFKSSKFQISRKFQLKNSFR